MQLCNAIVRLGGSLHNTVAKTNVTPAEILILRHIHGNDAVVDIRPVRFDKTIIQADERERLSKFYDRKAGGFTSQPGDDDKSIISKLFPGAIAKLPLTLTEIGLADIDPGEPVDKRPRGRKPKAHTAMPPEPAELVTGPIEEEDDEPAPAAPVAMSFATGPVEGDGEGEAVDAESAAAEGDA